MFGLGNWIVDVGVHFVAALRLVLGEVELVHVVRQSAVDLQKSMEGGGPPRVCQYT